MKFRISDRGRFLSALPFLLATLLLAPRTFCEEGRSNILFFLVDDLGWADIGAFGSRFYETPHLDALARSGVKFTQAYTAGSVCSPTRASIMTGRHPVRVGITDWLPGMQAGRVEGARFQHVNDAGELALKEITLAEVLKEAGYRTFFAGKWHLGGEGFLPTDQGFDVNIGGHHRGSPPGGYYAPWSNPYLESKKEGEYLTERLTNESIHFMEQNKNRPFLLYLSYYNVHTPIQPYRKRVEHFREKASMAFDTETPFVTEGPGDSRLRRDDPAYASMVAAVDDSVGAVLNRIDELGLRENTVVFFFSDNGGLCTLRGNRTGPTSNLPLRSGKGWLYEGGIRVPLIIRAPGVSTPGTICEQPVVSMDFFPTILELAGLNLRPQQHVDGLSLVPLLQQNGRLQERELVWHYPHYHGSGWNPGAAIRIGDWKLIEFYESAGVELYDLSIDPGERYNLTDQLTEKRNHLRERLRNWQETMGAQMPVER